MRSAASSAAPWTDGSGTRPAARPGSASTRGQRPPSILATLPTLRPLPSLAGERDGNLGWKSSGQGLTSSGVLRFYPFPSADSPERCRRRGTEEIMTVMEILVASQQEHPQPACPCKGEDGQGARGEFSLREREERRKRGKGKGEEQFQPAVEMDEQGPERPLQPVAEPAGESGGGSRRCCCPTRIATPQPTHPFLPGCRSVWVAAPLSSVSPGSGGRAYPKPLETPLCQTRGLAAPLPAEPGSPPLLKPRLKLINPGISTGIFFPGLVR